MSKPEQLMQENIADAKEPRLTEGGYEIAKTPELERIINQANELAEAMQGDKPVNAELVLEFEKAISQIKIKIGEETMTVEEIRRIPNFQRQIEINKQIIAGNIDNYSELTFLTNQAAEVLSEYEGGLNFVKLVSLSDQAAESLAKHQGGLWLDSLPSLSDRAAEFFSHHQGLLGFSGVTSLSDHAAESLSHHQGELSLYGLTSLSDQSAELLSHHQGTLGIYVASLSETAAEFLSRHQDLKLHEDMQAKIDKYKIKK